MESLAAYGWNSFFANQLGSSEEVPARVVSQQRGRCLAVTETGELPVELSGKLRFSALGRTSFPLWGIGWPYAFPRRRAGHRGRGARAQERHIARSCRQDFRRAGAGRQRGHGVRGDLGDRDFNPKRLERYLAMIWAGEPGRSSWSTR